MRAWNNTYDLPYLITRCSNNYGPYQHIEKLIPKVINNAIKGKKTFLFDGGQQIRDWIFVDDHCEAIWKLDEQEVINDKFNIGGNCEKQNIEVARKILNMMNLPLNLIGSITKENDIDNKHYFRKGNDLRYGSDLSKIKERIGWEPTTNFEEGLKITIDWYLKK